LKDRYRQVVLWSADGARGDYVDSWRADNPLGLLGAYEATTIVRVRVAAVELLGPGAARVRFESIRRDPGAREAAPERWTATLAFRYTGKPLRMEDRLINPLGFQVVSYRRDATVNAPQPITRDPAGTAAPGASVLEIQVTPPAAVAPVPDEAAGAAAVASAPSPVSTTSAKPAAEPTAPADAPLRTAPGAQKTQAEQAAPAKPKPKPPAKPPGGPKAADIPEGPNP
jgi:type IV secretion system protein VirB8